ncbi:hypothetical protein Aduo_007084 [Ancylostoma duodenale]
MAGIRLEENFRCDKKCVVDLFRGDFSTLTFDNDTDNLISFYQFYSTTTYLYYRECYQPMDYLKCRYRIGSDFELCICNDHVKKCTYDALLSWDEIWCTNQTIPTVTTEQVTHGADRSTETPSPLGPPVDIGSFSIFYKNEELDDWAHVVIAVNISIKYQAKNEKSSIFDVRNNGTQGFEFLVDGKKCRSHCTKQLESSYQVKLDIFKDIINTVTMIGNEHNKTLFNYQGCQQPLNGVVCRAKAGLPWCICNGHRNECAADAQLATGKEWWVLRYVDLLWKKVQ